METKSTETTKATKSTMDPGERPTSTSNSRRARRGSGCVYRPSYKTKDGTIRLGGWRVRYTSKHKVYDEKAPGKTKGAAEELLKKRFTEINTNEFAVGSGADKLRYEDLRGALLSHYEVDGLKSLRTARDGETKYIGGLSHVDRFFQGRYALDITTSTVEEFRLARVREGAQNANINRSLELLAQMFKIAVDAKKLAPFQAPEIKMLKEPDAREGFLEPKDFPRLNEALPDDLRPPAMLGFDTGMRLGEVSNLRWRSVDLDAEEISLRAEETKTGVPRTIPLGRMLEVLRIMRLRRPNDEYVFGGARPLGNFRKRWNAACVKAGLGQIEELADGKRKYRGLTFHDLRRSAVRNMVRAGVPEAVVMKITGHKTRAVFDRYNITSTDDLHDAAERRDDYVEHSISQRLSKEQLFAEQNAGEKKHLIQ